MGELADEVDFFKEISIIKITSSFSLNDVVSIAVSVQFFQVRIDFGDNLIYAKSDKSKVCVLQ